MPPADLVGCAQPQPQPAETCRLWLGTTHPPTNRCRTQFTTLCGCELNPETEGLLGNQDILGADSIFENWNLLVPSRLWLGTTHSPTKDV